MRYTTNYNLRKPEENDPVNIEDLNSNADQIDATLKEHEQLLTDHMQASNPHNITPAMIGAETPEGAQAKADAALADAQAYTDAAAHGIGEQIADLAGAGRTVETVRGNAENISALLETHKQTYANHLKGLISAIPLVNIENPNLLLDNSCINWENGDILSNASFFASGYLPVVKGQLYGYVGVETRFAFYDMQKRFIGKQTVTEDIRELEDAGGGTDVNNVSAFYFRSPIDGYFRHSIHKDRYNGFCFMAINNYQELYDCRSSGVYPVYSADNQYQYLNLTDDIESINAEIASKNSKLFLTPDSNQTYIKELFLTGVDPERELLIKQIDYIYPTGGRYRTAIFLSYEDDRNKTVARFLYYSDTAEFGKDNSVIFVTEDNDSGISGYALIDFSSFEQGTRINLYIRLNKMIYTDIKANKTIYENGVVMLNKQMENYVIQASRSANEQTYPNPALPLEFIHFSDIHQIEIVWRHVCEYMDEYEKYIQFAIHTGDYVGSTQKSTTNLYKKYLPKNRHIYNLPGNHDIYSDTGIIAPKSVTKRIVYPTEANVEEWGVIFGEEADALYWYKDFPDSKIRLVAIDQYYWDSTESDWLDDVLEEAKGLGYSVITASHSQPDVLTSIGSSFWSLDNWEASNSGEQSSAEYPLAFNSNLVNFVSGGGEIICHLCGHYHHDKIGITNDGILCITIECAYTGTQWTDTVRVEGTKSLDVFNVVAADTALGLLKIIRIGCNSDNHLQSKNVLCYDYKNQKIITNF